MEMDLNVPSGGTLEDAILITSVAGAIPREVFKLGDIDLSQPNLTFTQAAPAASTHWWLIGSMGGDVVYSSNTALAGVDLYSVEPYDIQGAELAWNIPANLDGYVNGTAYSLDWWVQIMNNHSSHVAPDTAAASLWKFNTAGSDIGDITFRLSVP